MSRPGPREPATQAAARPDAGPRAAARPELPRDPWSLPPMGPAFDAALDDGLAQLGLADEQAGGHSARRSYEAHARLLQAWGRAINLTAIREPAEVARRHVCDSLSAVPLLAGRPAGGALLDLGSGGGYPGLPLAAALPLARVGLLDSVAKKARFLDVAASAVRAELVAAAAGGLGSRPGEAAGVHMEAIPERAEDLAEEPDQRAAWDVVTARAVGSLAEVLELAMPLLREGGLVIAWKREAERNGLGEELRAAGSIIRASGGGRPEVVAVPAALLPDARLVVVHKERPTPAGYPRPAGDRRRARR